MPKPKKNSRKHVSKARSRTAIASTLPINTLVAASLIVVAVFLVYLPALSGGFVLDDDLLLTENNLIQAPDGLHRFWCTAEATDYWPVTNTTLWIEWRLWGMHPDGYHVTNLILHIVESLLIWVILRKLSVPGAFWAAVIFAVHPVSVESVAWIASRKNLMAMLFALLSILWYLKYIKHAHRLIDHAGQRSRTMPAFSSFILHPSSFYLWYWLSLAAFVLAMLSKGSAAVLPVLLLLIVWWLRPLTKWDLLRTVPFFLVAAVLSGVNVWFQTHGSGEVIRSSGFVERLLAAGVIVWFYLYKAFLPVDLAFIYPLWHVDVGNPLWWLPLAAALALTAALWWYRNAWSRPFLFAWSFFCVALVPVLGFVDVGFMKHSLVADRYQHAAIIAAIALAAAGWNLWRRHARDTFYWAAATIAFAAAGSLAFLTWQQNGLYHDALTLYQAALQKNPNSWMAHYNLANDIETGGASTRGHRALPASRRAESRLLRGPK